MRLGLTAVWVKDESHRFDLRAYKILGAAWAAVRTLNRRFGPLPSNASLATLARVLDAHRPLELVAASEGNHGRAVARVACWLELNARIFVPANATAWRMALIRKELAEVVAVDGTYDDAVDDAVRYSDGCRRLLISDTAVSGEQDSPRDVVEGYSTLFREIADQLPGNAQPALLAVQIGVGSLAAAAVNYSGMRVLGVEPVGADCVHRSIAAGQLVEVAGPYDPRMAGLNCGRPSLSAWPVLRTGLSGCVAVLGEDAVRAAELLARDGVFTTPTGAAGLAGLIKALPSLASAEADAYRERGVVVIATEGEQRLASSS
jgi:diaminopropionate ammonia-lyase